MSGVSTLISQVQKGVRIFSRKKKITLHMIIVVIVVVIVVVVLFVKIKQRK
jgi:t-SNARE complex subunit (syntaxin)